jgi:chemotaxis signal transduction protein
MLPRRSSHVTSVPKGKEVIFALAHRRFAVPAERVVEVANVATFTALPCENAVHRGVVLHRNTLIPLVDLGRQLGVWRGDPGPSPGLCLFCRTDLGEVAYPVDEVLGLAAAADQRFRQFQTLAGGISICPADACEECHGQAAAR